MIAVIFEVYPKTSGIDDYFEKGAKIKKFLEDRDGFISVERFQSMRDEGKFLSLSFWENEDAIKCWRTFLEHRTARKKGKDDLFSRYHIRVAEVIRDYTDNERSCAPQDSNDALCL